MQSLLPTPTYLHGFLPERSVQTTTVSWALYESVSNNMDALDVLCEMDGYFNAGTLWEGSWRICRTEQAFGGKPCCL